MVSKLGCYQFNKGWKVAITDAKRYVPGNPIRIARTRYFLLKLKLKYNDVISDERNFFDQLIQNDLRKYDNIQNIMSFQENDDTTRYLLNVFYFKEHYKMTAVDFNKQKALYAKNSQNNATN